MPRPRVSADGPLRRTCLVLAVLLVGTALGCGNGAGAKGAGGGQGAAAAAEFDSGRELVCTGDYAKAIPVLEGYLTAHPGGKDASRARFFIAKAELGQLHHDAARKAFQQTIDDYPDSLEAHKSKYKLAELDLYAGKTDEALVAFDKLAKSPDGPLAPEATAFADHLRKQAAAVGEPEAK